MNFSRLSFLLLFTFLLFGCQTSRYEYTYDASKPLIEFTTLGIKFNDRLVLPSDVPDLLRAHRIPTDATIPIYVEDSYAAQDPDLRALWVFKRNILARNGYTRAIQVSKRHAESMTKEQYDAQERERINAENPQLNKNRGASRPTKAGVKTSRSQK